MTDARPLEPTEILPRSGTAPAAPRDGRPIRASAGTLPVLASAAVVTGGVAAAAAVGGIKAVLSLGRALTTAGRGRRPEAVGGIMFGYSTGTIVSAGLRIDWTRIEVRADPRPH